MVGFCFVWVCLFNKTANRLGIRQSGFEVLNLLSVSVLRLSMIYSGIDLCGFECLNC